MDALETELKAKQKEEAEVVAAHKANHDSVVSEERRKKHLEQSLRVVRRQLQCENAYPSLDEIESNTVCRQFNLY